MADGLHILVVDDHAALRETLCLMLEVLGHKATAAASGAEALARAREAAPDVVLMDLSLPDQSGFEACSALQNLPGLAHTRFIAHSGHSDRGHVDAAHAAGFHGYLVKPVSLETLEATLAG